MNAHQMNEALHDSPWLSPYGWDATHEADELALGTRAANAMTWENRSRRPVLLGIVKARRASK